MRDSDRFQALVSAHFPGGRIESARPLEGGVSADASLLDLRLADGNLRRLVLREHGETHCGHEARLEFRLLESLRALDVPAPEPLAFGTGDGADRLPYVLLDYIEGSTDIPPSAAEARIVAAAEALISIHDLDTATLPPLPPRLDALPELLAFLPEDAEYDGLRAALSRLSATAFQGRGVLLHGDYWPANIVWRNGTIAGIIDWEDAAIGDPLSDVACACLELRYLYERRGARCFLDAFAAHRPVDPVRLALWQAHVAAAGNRSMDGWGLDPARVQAMRTVALDSIREAGRVIVAQ